MVRVSRLCGPVAADGLKLSGTSVHGTTSSDCANAGDIHAGMPSAAAPANAAALLIAVRREISLLMIFSPCGPCGLCALFNAVNRESLIARQAKISASFFRPRNNLYPITYTHPPRCAMFHPELK